MNMHIIAYCRKQTQFANRRLQRYNLELMNDDINFMGNDTLILWVMISGWSFIIVLWPTFPSFTEKKVAQQSWWSAKWESWNGIYNITFCMELQKQTSIHSDKFDHCARVNINLISYRKDKWKNMNFCQRRKWRMSMKR